MITRAQLQEIELALNLWAKDVSRDRESFDARAAAIAIIRSALATASPSESGDGDAKELPAPANETRGGTGDDCSVGKRGAWPPQGGESSRPLVKACDDEGLTARRDGTLPASDWDAGAEAMRRNAASVCGRNDAIRTAIAALPLPRRPA